MRVAEAPILGLAGGAPRGGTALDKVLGAQRVSHRNERVVKETIARALAAEPDDRFASVSEFTARLREAVGRRLVPRLRLPQVRWKALLVGGATVAALATASVMLLGKRAPSLDPRRVVVAGFEDLSGD